MKRTTNAYDILNSFPNSRPYTSLDKEDEIKETILKKYSDFSRKYLQESFDIGDKFSDNIIKILKERVSAKTGVEPKQWTGAEWEYRGKITEKEGVYDKINMVREKLSSYDKQLNNFAEQIKYSDDMKTADTIAAQYKNYHDSNIGNLFAQTEEALHDFEVDVVKILGE